MKSAMAVRLTVDMVDGAVLPPVDTWLPNGKPHVAELMAFARSRGFTGLSGQSKDRLAKRCRDHLACEKARGGTIGLRAPMDGLSLLKEKGGWDLGYCR